MSLSYRMSSGSGTITDLLRMTAVKSDTVNAQLILWRFFDTKMIQFGDITNMVYNDKRGVKFYVEDSYCGR